MYYKYPSTMFVDSFCARLEMVAEETEAHAVSPRRHDLRNRAAENMAKTAGSIRSKLLAKSPKLLIKKGDVVLVPLDDIDRTKVDGGNLSGVVVSVNKLNSSCRVAVAQGLLHRAYALKLLPEASNNIDLNNLRDAYENYLSLPRLTEREAARYVSSVGVQGIVHCNCRSDCTKNSCSCKKANRLCSSCCHRNNNKCKNKHDDNVDSGK
jgi:translation initiation factor IF-1